MTIINNLYTQDLSKRGFDVFVYGTLKKGFHNHSYLENETFLGNATSAIKLILYEKHRLPYVHLHKDKLGKRIKGEVYRVSDLSLIDRLEGVPFHYQPKMIPVVFDEDESGTFYQCRCYMVADYAPIESDEWLTEWT